VILGGWSYSRPSAISLIDNYDFLFTFYNNSVRVYSVSAKWRGSKIATFSTTYSIHYWNVIKIFSQKATFPWYDAVSVVG